MLKKIISYTVIIILMLSQLIVPVSATFPGENGKISAFKYGRGVIFDGCDASSTQYDQTVFNSNLTNPTRLTINNDTYNSPQHIRWSPDGNQYAYSSGQWSFGLANATTNISEGGKSFEYSPDSPDIAWSPDSITVALTSFGLYTMRLDDYSPQLRSWGIPGDLHELNSPRWSPKGDFIVYSKPTTGPPHHDRIGILRPDGTDHRLFPKPSGTKYDFGADWSPDGTKIIFASNRAQEASQSSSDPTQIFTMNTDGTQIIQLTNAYQYRYENPIWSPDGTKIAVIRSSPNTTDSISLVILDSQTGSELTVHTPECNVGFSDLEWQSLGTPKVYRMANWKTKERLFTTNKNEALFVPNNHNGWILEGMAFSTQSQSSQNISPVYRLANWKTKERLFTTNSHERDIAITNYEGWVSEGVAFYAQPSYSNGLIPVYRLANWKTKERLFTSDISERDHAVANYDGWVSEGVAFYAPSN